MEKIHAFLRKWNTRTPRVKFQGSSEVKKDYNNKTEVALSKRIIILMGVVAIAAIILICRLGYIQITQQELYKTKLEKYGVTNYTKDAPRGEITDRNYVKLVQNSNVITATYYAPKSITSDEIEVTANFLSKNVNINLDSLTLRQRKDYFMIAFPDEARSLVSDEEKEELSKHENYTNALNDLILSRITDEMIESHMDHELMEVTHLTYLMEQCTSGSSVLIENLTVEEASLIGQNASLLKGVQVTSDWTREKKYDSFGQVLGAVSTKKQGLPATLKDELLALDYQNDSRVGTSGLEYQYENLLRGIDNTYSLAYDTDGSPLIQNEVIGKSGDNLRLTIDWELQEYANSLIDEQLTTYNSRNKYFTKAFAILMDPKTGEILVMAGRQINKETGEITDCAAGNYVETHLIGSTTKGGTIYMAFKEGVITPNTYLVDEPIKIKGTKEKKSWTTMGNINEIDALARSSNVYMFKVMMKLGNASYVYNEALNIDQSVFEIYRQAIGELGLGVKTGLDVPYEELGVKGTERLGGYALDLSIGQYDTYTNIQLAQYASTLANRGIRVQPKLLLNSFRVDENGNNVPVYKKETNILDDVSDQVTAFEQIHNGFIACVQQPYGTCTAQWKGKSYSVASKTGTAEDYSGGENIDYPNHLNIGWATEENPQIVYAVMCIRQSYGAAGTEGSATYIASRLVDRYNEKYGFQ